MREILERAGGEAMMPSSSAANRRPELHEVLLPSSLAMCNRGVR